MGTYWVGEKMDLVQSSWPSRSMGIVFQDSKLHLDSRLIRMVNMVIGEVEVGFKEKRVFLLTLLFTVSECWYDLLTS